MNCIGMRFFTNNLHQLYVQKKKAQGENLELFCLILYLVILSATKNPQPIYRKPTVSYYFCITRI